MRVTVGVRLPVFFMVFACSARPITAGIASFIILPLATELTTNTVWRDAKQGTHADERAVYGVIYKKAGRAG